MLTFVAEHHLIQDCDAAGSGDAAIYPGSSGERGEQAANPDYRRRRPGASAHRPRHGPRGPRGVQHRDPPLRHAPQRHRLLGDGGQLGLGPPQRPLRQRDGVRHRRLHRRRPPRLPPGLRPDRGQRVLLQQLQPVHRGRRRRPRHLRQRGRGGALPRQARRPRRPELAGLHRRGPEDPGARSARRCSSPGVNNNTIRNNHMWDNWRRGTMLFAVPDSFVCGGNANPLAGPATSSTVATRASSTPPTATSTTAT